MHHAHMQSQYVAIPDSLFCQVENFERPLCGSGSTATEITMICDIKQLPICSVGNKG